MYHYTLRTIKEVNYNAGYFWFDVESMRFFRSRLSSDVYGGRFFVSSEKIPNNVRKYSVRETLECGRIVTVGEFQKYHTRSQAIAAAKRVAS